MFYGEKLRVLRELAACSHAELAHALGVDADLLVKIEENQVVPEFMLLQKLHKYFEVGVSYFFETPYVLEVLTTARLSYRKLVDLSRADVEIERTFLDVFFTHLSQLEDVVFPTQDFIMGFSEQVEESYQLANLRDSDIRKIAETARVELQIGTNQRLMYFLEVSGLYIVERDLKNRTDAYSAWLLDGIYPIIVLNDGRNPVVKRNFSMARELGHLLLHPRINFDQTSKDELDELDRQARLFASCFLLPAEEFAKEFSKLTDPTDPMDYVGLKIKYQVSILEMAKYAHVEGWLSEADYRKFWQHIQRHGYEIHEPLDEELIVHIPGKLRASLSKAEEIHNGQLNKWLIEYSVEVSYFERVFGVKDDLLRKYLSECKEDVSTEENIIRLDKQ